MLVVIEYGGDLTTAVSACAMCAKGNASHKISFATRDQLAQEMGGCQPGDCAAEVFR